MYTSDFALLSCRNHARWRFAASAFCVGAALLAVMCSQSEPPTGHLLLILVLGAFAAAVFGGFWPGIISSIMGGLVAWYVFLPEPYTLAISSVMDGIAIALYFALAIFCCVLTEWLFRALEFNRRLLRRVAHLERELRGSTRTYDHLTVFQQLQD
jgi:K+-sensing histidine kinase KdpD